jgi:hypothetical protein
LLGVSKKFRRFLVSETSRGSSSTIVPNFIEIGETGWKYVKKAHTHTHTHTSPHRDNRFSVAANIFSCHLAMLPADTGKSEAGGHLNVDQPPVICAFCSLDLHDTHSFRLLGARGSNCDYTAAYIESLFRKCFKVKLPLCLIN